MNKIKHYFFFILIIFNFSCNDELSLSARKADLNRIEIFNQKNATKVDVLWVIDNSESIKDEREFIANGFDGFVNHLKNENFDFNLGVTSTEVRDSSQLIAGVNGRFRCDSNFEPNPGSGGCINSAILKSNTPNLVNSFKHRLNFKNAQTAKETGLMAMEKAVNGTNPGFPRKDAALAVIVVSDEDDGSDKGADYYARKLLSLKNTGDEGLVTFSAIVGPAPEGCTRPGEEKFLYGDAKPGLKYLELVKKLKGVSVSVCSTNFSLALQNLSKSIARLKKKYCLSEKVGSITSVKVNGAMQNEITTSNPAGAYKLNGKCIEFADGKIPPLRSNIEINYKKTGSTKSNSNGGGQ